MYVCQVCTVVRACMYVCMNECMYVCQVCTVVRACVGVTGVAFYIVSVAVFFFCIPVPDSSRFGSQAPHSASADRLDPETLAIIRDVNMMKEKAVADEDFELVLLHI